MKTLILSALTILAFAMNPATAQTDFGTLIFNHEIATGMTFSNVVAAWGNPGSVDRSFSNYGVTEYWFMRNGWMVVFENGRVASFHQFNAR